MFKFLTFLVPILSLTKLASTSLSLDSLGCKIDTLDFHRNNWCDQTFEDTKMTLEMCARFCDVFSYTTFATTGFKCCCFENRTEVDSMHDSLPQANCTRTCSGNSAEYCGGPSLNQINVYGSNETNYYEKIGCFVTKAADFSDEADYCSAWNGTIGSCVDCCAEGNFSYAALSVGCYCTNSDLNEVVLYETDQNECGIGCFGNRSERCGGYSFVGSFYEIKNSISSSEDFFAVWTGSFENGYNCAPKNCRTVFVPINQDQYVSMIDLVRICSAFGTAHAAQSVPPYVINSRLITCIQNTTILRQIDGWSPSLHSEHDLSYMDDSNGVMEVYDLVVLRTKFRVNPTQVYSTRHYGCYADSIAQAIYSSANMSIQMCIQFCASLDFSFSGTRQSSCYCGVSLEGEKIDSSQCNLTCPGDSSVCGGNISISLYQVNLDNPNSAFFTPIADSDMPYMFGNIISTSVAPNALVCGNSCRLSAMCSSFVYKPDDRNCTMYVFTTSDDLLVPTSRAYFYVKNF